MKALLENDKVLQAEFTKVKEELCAVKEECQAVKDELQAAKEGLQAAKEQLEDMIALTNSGSSPNPSYAEIARTPPGSSPSNLRTISSGNTAPSNFTNTLYCTIDTSQVANEASGDVSAGAIRLVIEKEVRAGKDNSTWRCRAVTKDPKNPPPCQDYM